MQINVSPQREWLLRFVRRIEAVGVRMLVVTVDTPVVENRRHRWDGVTLPAPLTFPMLDGIPLGAEDDGGIHRPGLDAGFDDEALARLVEECAVPVVVKGVLRGDDALRAVAAGAAGVIVSNHGGRNLDGCISTIRALPGVMSAVGERVPVLMDGGIRIGSEVAVALALGATAVLVGRPVLWGLAAAGAAGVRRALDVLTWETRMTLALCGARTPSELTIDMVDRGHHDDEG